MPKKKKPSIYSANVQAKLDEIRTAREDYEKSMKTHGKSLVKKMAGELMAKFQEVEAVRWSQYTPYFNDGDACQFSVREPSIKLSTEFLQSLPKGEDDHNIYESYNDDGWVDYISTYNKKTPKRLKELAKAKHEFYLALAELEQAMLECFGDHVEVTIFRSGKVEAEEHDHD